ncbi:MAG: hypothetical protein IPM24_15885 [Bryobacterales bacterium]|jgi:hypothetical protein|nr:hypothetical protein [Bryobacterales bacterium]
MIPTSALRQAIECGDYARVQELLEAARPALAAASPDTLSAYAGLLSWALRSVLAQRSHEQARLAQLPQQLHQYRSTTRPQPAFEIEG